jgi:hypothetical protein
MSVSSAFSVPIWESAMTAKPAPAAPPPELLRYFRRPRPPRSSSPCPACRPADPAIAALLHDTAVCANRDAEHRRQRLLSPIFISA